MQDATSNSEELDDKTQAEIDLFARFLAFTSRNIHADSEASRVPRLMVLFRALSHFGATYLSDIDIHSLVSSFDTDSRKLVLSAFFLAYATLQENKVEGLPKLPTPSLFALAKEGETSVYALFGGQGINEVYFDELQSLFDIYRPFVEDWIKRAVSEVLIPLAAENHSSTSFYAHGLDVYSWLTGASPVPPVSYLASVPVSFPLIGLTQFVQYLIVARVSGLSYAELNERLAGATGHSQGLVTAVCISASTDDESYLQNARKGLLWLFHAGLRGQQAFPVLALEPTVVQDAIEGGEGTPTPMLAVGGLLLKDLEPYVAKTNKHLPFNSQLHISLHNGDKTFVVTGPPRALYGLVTALRKVKAPSGVDQSKTPFSQRKPVFTVRFLTVGVPYHSEYLKEAVDKLCTEDLKEEELWSAKDLKIPVFHTEDGTPFFFIFIDFRW